MATPHHQGSTIEKTDSITATPCLASPVWIGILFATGIGLALRLTLLIAAGWRFDYDEAMVGLQVMRIMRGELPVFHPGQPYLGALESYAITPLFFLFEPSPVTLKLVPWLLSGGYVLTTGLIGWRAFGPRTGVLSALFGACAPTYLLIVGTKTWGATAETLLLGNAAFLLAQAVLDAARPKNARIRTLLVLALVGGIAFWVSWLIAFYALPILVVMIWKARPLLRSHWWQVICAFAVGSAPFWAYNLTHELTTFDYLLRNQATPGVTIPAILDHLNYDVAPRLVSGDPTWRTLSWPAIWWLQLVYEAGCLALVTWLWRDPWTQPGRNMRLLLGIFTIMFVPIYVLSGFGSHAINEFGFDATGRYVLVIHSILPIGAAALLVWIARQKRGLNILVAALTISVIALNVLGAVQTDRKLAFTSPYYTRQPATLEPLIEFLDNQGIRHVWTDVGIAHVLMFETEERILAADWYDIYGAKGIVRFPEIPQIILQASRVAYVEVTLPGQTDTRVEQAFRAADVPYATAQVTPDLLVIIPLAPIDPSKVGDGLGYQF